MNDELLKILLTESDVNMIMDALNGAIMPTPESQDLMHDLLEQVARHDDPDWSIDIEPTDIDEGTVIRVAEEDFISAGIQAREQVKATSRAAERRQATFKFGKFTIKDPSDDTTEVSEMQSHDVWARPNDPLKW